MTKYFKPAETAGLIRKALKEAFPDMKFSVRTSTYSGGASIRVSWTDGPNGAQVEAIAKTFSGSYFDGMTGYKGSNYYMVDGERASFGADFIFCERSYSDAMIVRAIGKLTKKYAPAEVCTVEQFRNGKAGAMVMIGDSWSNYWCWQEQIYQTLAKMSDRLTVQPSPTAGRVKYLGDDGAGYMSTGRLFPKAVEA